MQENINFDLKATPFKMQPSFSQNVYHYLYLSSQMRFYISSTRPLTRGPNLTEPNLN